LDSLNVMPSSDNCNVAPVPEAETTVVVLLVVSARFVVVQKPT
jgi:hypothetical protein